MNLLKEPKLNELGTGSKNKTSNNNERDMLKT